MWAFDLTGLVRKVCGRPIKIDRQLTEVFNWQMGQRHVLASAHYQDDGSKILLKMRYELNPRNLKKKPPFSRDDADGNFLHEIDLVNVVYETGHGPKYLAHATQPAGSPFPYPDGEVDFLVMEHVPGDIVGHIYRDLSIDQLQSMRHQLAFIFTRMGACRYSLSEQHPNFLRYDAENDKLYLVDFTFMDMDENPLPKITMDNAYILEFNIWGALNNTESLD